MMGANAAAVVNASGSAIRHVQIADVPGRHEPGTGTVDFDDLFGALVRAKYQGWIGCEYNPSGRNEDGLGWIQPYVSEWRM
jgi:hydroxypyruvate isomerase